MTPVDLDSTSVAVLSWLLTYAIHSTILLGAAVAIATRFADEHAWLDLVWKTALLGPLVTASVHVGSSVMPLGGRWPLGPVAQVAGAPAMPLAPRAETAVKPEKTVGLPSSQVSGGGESVQPAPPAATNADAWHRLARMWPLVAVLSWLAIGAFGLVRFAARLLRVHRALGSGTPVSAPPLRQTVETLCDAARERSPIRLTTSVCGPSCACRSTHRAAGAISAAARRRGAAGRAGA